MTADYTYDGLERMAIRATQNMTPSGTTHYIYDLAGHLIAEATNSGTMLREYVWLDDMPLAVVADLDTASPNLYFAHADHLDRPVQMTDAGKALVWDAVYRPFGAVETITGSASNNLRFPPLKPICRLEAENAALRQQLIGCNARCVVGLSSPKAIGCSLLCCIGYFRLSSKP